MTNYLGCKETTVVEGSTPTELKCVTLYFHAYDRSPVPIASGTSRLARMALALAFEKLAVAIMSNAQLYESVLTALPEPTKELVPTAVHSKRQAKEEIERLRERLVASTNKVNNAVDNEFITFTNLLSILFDAKED